MTKPDKQPTQDEIAERANQIMAERNIGIVDAAIAAERELQPKSELQTSFEIVVTVKPRVARWIASEFGGHESLSIEERLAAHVAVVLGRDRMRTARFNAEAPEIGEGKAVSMTREQFTKQAPRG